MDYSTISAEELALACFRTRDESAWAEFVRRFHTLIAGVALRVARQWGEASPQVVDDLVQETYLKLCADRPRLMQNFASAHENSVYGYIKVFTANLSHDHFKASHSLKRGGAAVFTSRDCENPIEALPGAASPAGTADRKVLIREVDACLRGVTEGSNSERDRRVFWLYYRAGLTASAIAALPMIGVNVKGVESILQRLTRQVREQLVSAGQKGQEAKMPEKGFHARNRYKRESN